MKPHLEWVKFPKAFLFPSGWHGVKHAIVTRDKRGSLPRVGANLYGSQATVDGHSTLNRTIRVGSTPTASTNFKQEEAVQVSMDITRC